jgi:hypothetical protein
MKLLFFVLFFVCYSKTFAHSYFFAFAEVEYNVMQEKLEGTLIFTRHDLEEALIKKGIISSTFEKLQHDSLSISAIGNTLFNDFKFFSNQIPIKLSALDFSLTKNGLIEIYFKSEKVKLSQNFELQFNSLMDIYPKQQNKITFIQNSEKRTYVFMNNESRRKITISN